jgi:hypothetical protein
MSITLRNHFKSALLSEDRVKSIIVWSIVLAIANLLPIIQLPFLLFIRRMQEFLVIGPLEFEYTFAWAIPASLATLATIWLYSAVAVLLFQVWLVYWEYLTVKTIPISGKAVADNIIGEVMSQTNNNEWMLVVDGQELYPNTKLLVRPNTSFRLHVQGTTDIVFESKSWEVRKKLYER